MNKAVSGSDCNSCSDCCSEPITKDNASAPCGDSDCTDCPSEKNAVSANTPCTHCGDNCSCAHHHQKLTEVPKKA